MTASTVRITAPAVPRLGEERMSFLMNPCGADGVPINGGNHYANADTLEGARGWAAGILASDTHLGYRVESVSIFGRLMRFTGQAWVDVKGGRLVTEIVNRPTA